MGKMKVFLRVMFLIISTIFFFYNCSSVKDNKDYYLADSTTISSKIIKNDLSSYMSGLKYKLDSHKVYPLRNSTLSINPFLVKTTIIRQTVKDSVKYIYKSRGRWFPESLFSTKTRVEKIEIFDTISLSPDYLRVNGLDFKNPYSDAKIRIPITCFPKDYVGDTLEVGYIGKSYYATFRKDTETDNLLERYYKFKDFPQGFKYVLDYSSNAIASESLIRAFLSNIDVELQEQNYFGNDSLEIFISYSTGVVAFTVKSESFDYFATNSGIGYISVYVGARLYQIIGTMQKVCSSSFSFRDVHAYELDRYLSSFFVIHKTRNGSTITYLVNGAKDYYDNYIFKIRNIFYDEPKEELRNFISDYDNGGFATDNKRFIEYWKKEN